MSEDPADDSAAELDAASEESRQDKVLGWVGALNRRPQLIEGLRRVRRALPGDPAFGDPLSTAGPGTARAVARVADRFLDHQPGASREMSLGALQVWQALLERTGRGRGTREVTIVFTDLVGFSSWSLPAGDTATLALLRDVAKAIETPMVDRGGHVVKRMGDGVMAVFPSPDRAVDAVFAAQDALRNVEVDGYRPRMRVGIHTGVPRQLGSDWLGVDVTIAARMMELGGDGNVMASSATLSALQPGTLEELGISVKPWRRAFFAPAPSGVPSDLGIWRLRLRRP
ncbi:MULTISPECIES: adenylate/guanylate cyclase domain-containing protein [Rhodococcus]|uniref:Adenylate/guanylate cyclase domain-containing protein n=1 Tax=Rhodococcus oxybenzonivorans TaxID=1990687 RepID=A0AAE4UZW2_9NOCA|nr:MULTISPECIES: adenylate/guanylate cyclase domain-containing protein [Rhodococcus]MDV7240625.1 adenylate/guanylate cyclase domain-containing protein [Rhodococcus oxybenzonivorans]MDV7265233.1 adenylate/guanylate cyclase domain-containing protein [Rhodococcus oxybenzonivorans]MDV7272898.1 adenylate/guanylate cyclase domain-containing protein [Rhodococcus oxybenzonivorans]MDV7333363.1 adenylate/guanylate cyclase domain-containing protein [Rhodococcus oxybenzonivorans]MDV7342530.1 adenylate/gua